MILILALVAAGALGAGLWEFWGWRIRRGGRMLAEELFLRRFILRLPNWPETSAKRLALWRNVIDSRRVQRVRRRSG